MIKISREAVEEFAAYDDFEEEYFAENRERLEQLTSQEYWNVRELEEEVSSFWDEEDLWRRASTRAYDRLANEAQELWESEANGPLRRHVRRLRQRIDQGEREVRATCHELCTLQMRLEEEGKPPVCKCGAISYTVECAGCRRVLRWGEWQEA